MRAVDLRQRLPTVEDLPPDAYLERLHNRPERMSEKLTVIQRTAFELRIGPAAVERVRLGLGRSTRPRTSVVATDWHDLRQIRMTAIHLERALPRVGILSRRSQRTRYSDVGVE